MRLLYDGESLVVSSGPESVPVSASDSLPGSAPESDVSVSSDSVSESFVSAAQSYYFTEKPFDEYTQIEGYFVFGFVLVLFVVVFFVFGRAGRGHT